MEREDIRSRLHAMIDEIKTEEQLKAILMLMEPQAVYQTVNWLDALNEEQQERLEKAIGGADKGEFIDNEAIKSKYAQWLK